MRALGANPVTLRQAVGLLEQAVALDSTFVEAWVALSAAAGGLYNNGAPTPALADRTRTAAERALALKPDYPGGYWALGGYYRLVTNAPARAAEEFTKGLALAPADADLLRGMGLVEQSLGRWEQSVEHLRRSQSLDPLSANTAGVLGSALTWLRRYDEAANPIDQALALGPSNLSNLEYKVMLYLAQGDLAGARTMLATAATRRGSSRTSLPTWRPIGTCIGCSTRSSARWCKRLTPASIRRRCRDLGARARRRV